ncbi:SseB family protein [Nonomuraea sp. NPDC005501]|uniref:SseB family protein n=1 Tax=Nonomuraea sp. NPDC005501 TaxID=3156884 RepID=UPI0033B32273
MHVASSFEEELGRAHARGDLATCLALLRTTAFACPVSDEAAAGETPVPWPTFSDAERTWVVAFTSPEAMGESAGRFFVVTLLDLVAGWPDPSWGLAVNPGRPVCFYLEPGTVARLAVPSLLEDVALGRASRVPVMQKLLRPFDVLELLTTGRPRVSGYCHIAADVAHLTTPTALTEALFRDEALTRDGTVNILRWPAVGLSLYRTPYGGTDEESMKAVAGWVVEEPPFGGMGLVPNAHEMIREYKIDGILLPYGAEIVELGADGEERLRAQFDADRGKWLVHEEDPA